MKRSNMIEIIWKRLGPLGIAEETCEEVLSLLESSGMLPPRIELPQLGTSDNAWEPE